MHVQGKSPARVPRPPFAAAVIAMFASVAGIANAVEFDEKLKAPQSKDAAELRSRAQTYSERAAQARLSGPGASIRDRNLAAERFDVEWDLERSIDLGKPLGDLSAVGIVDHGDGSYGVDLAAHPQWSDPAAQLAGLLPVLSSAGFSAELARRGMLPEAVAKLSGYVATHDAKAAAAAAALPVSLSFSRVVRKYDKLKRPVPDSLVFAYLYQRERAASEARRAWAENLVDTLGADAVRIMESYFAELQNTAVWTPSDPRAGIDGTLASLRLPDFEQKATAEAQAVTP
jgi:hypothetical protein